MKKISQCREVQDIVKQLLKSGWVIKSVKNHIRLWNSESNRTVTLPKTPSDRRAILNLKSQLRSNGVVLC